jgi:hypothetical protein
MTRTTRLLAGLLATLVTAVPAGAHAVAAKGEAAPAMAKPTAPPAEKATRHAATKAGTAVAKPSSAKRAAGGTAGRTASTASGGTSETTGATQKTASANGKTTPASKTGTAKSTGSAGARVAKRASGAGAQTSAGGPRVTAAAVRSSGLLVRDDSGATEALCYRRTAGRGRCEPQCLPYTRCRSGIDSCRTGHENGPVTWFQCEQSRGNTSLEPGDGTILVLGRNKHNMPTGHTLYVEKAAPRDDGRYDLVLSHTNYDRRCNLETNVAAVYDKDSKTIDMQTGNWAAWGRDLKVAGFILN